MIRPLVCAVFIAVWVAACSAQKPLILSKEAHGTTVTVNRKATFTIALEGNASTGFSWNILTLDTTVIARAGKMKYISRDTVPGTSGTFYLDFTPVKKGVSTIALTYNRDFEIDVPPEDTFSVIIKVK
ncbi:MAG: protease inhibitor I42 family protein [Chitinispirillaceae bacterium]|nr:protease inhibitor I42 family protein [Chitinispirillaceae bacterium]